MKDNKEIRKREALQFPECIGEFDDEPCQNATEENPGSDCWLCPKFKGSIASNHKTKKKEQEIANFMKEEK